MFEEYLRERKWDQWLFSTPEYAIELVREFYSKLPDQEARFKLFVRGKWVTYAAHKVNECQKLPGVSDKDFWDLQDRTFEELATPLCVEGATFRKELVRMPSMKTEASIWALLFLAKLVPNKHHSTITRENIEGIAKHLGMPSELIPTYPEEGEKEDKEEERGGKEGGEEDGSGEEGVEEEEGSGEEGGEKEEVKKRNPEKKEKKKEVEKMKKDKRGKGGDEWS
ncbi:hypothetical protein H6P81_017910 [Aristolochia fimbriata]|uniref:Putative plant transposon protein domain-containing protein n=1 Tax=Aristolochia fimbriata TaxID=158543 RepID=A0AAV7E0X8_ARIFI|nr:hypothetical protein H6P81_017910 [Aristolochia fimbriata]